MTIKKTSLLMLMLLLSQQFWTIKIGLVSIPMIALMLAAIISYKQILRFNIFVYIVIAYLAISATYHAKQWESEYIQYTPFFTFLALIFWWFSIALLLELKDRDYESALKRIAPYCIVVAFIGVIMNSPMSIATPMDGEMGFFNEKGLFGYYISILSCVVFVYSRRRIGWIVLLISIIYSVYIIGSSRSLLIYASLLVLYFENINIKKSINFSVGSLFLIGILYFGGALDETLGKLQIIQENSGVIGRYAATFTVTQLALPDILFGTGFGTYLDTRSLYVDVLPELPYDYAGSFLLEMIVEIGIVQTTLLYLGLTKLLFNKVSFSLFMVVMMLTLTGGKQDLQMLFGLIIFSLIYKSIAKYRVLGIFTQKSRGWLWLRSASTSLPLARGEHYPSKADAMSARFME